MEKRKNSTGCKRCGKNHRCRRICRKSYVNIDDYKNHMINHVLSEPKCPHCHRPLAKSKNSEEAQKIYVEHLSVCQKGPKCLVLYISDTLQSVSEHNFCSDETNLSSGASHEKADYTETSEDENHGGAEICELPSASLLQNCEKSKKNTSESDESHVVFARTDSCLSDRQSTNIKCVCGNIFSTQNSYEAHVTEKHNSLHCSACNTTFRNVLSHALHFCDGTPGIATSTVASENHKHSAVSLSTSSVEKTLPAPPNKRGISRLSAGTSLISVDETYDIKPNVRSDSSYIPGNKLRKISVPKMAVTSSSFQVNTKQNPSLSASANCIRSTAHSIQNNCNVLPEQTSPIYKPNAPLTNKSWNYAHVQASDFAHQMSQEHLASDAKAQHHHRNYYVHQPQFGVAQMGKTPCNQCQTSKEVGFNNEIMKTGFPKPVNDSVLHVKNPTNQHKSGYYVPSYSNTSLCLVPATDINNSKIYETLSQNPVSLENQYGSPLHFQEILSMDSSLDFKNKICIASAKNFPIQGDPAGKRVSVTFPEFRSECQATAVLSTATDGSIQSIKQYNCEKCTVSFLTAESVILHLETVHHINIDNELKVYAL